VEIIEKAALAPLLQRARDGDSEAQERLGYYCENGAMDPSGHLLIPIQPEQALAWYEQAAQQGSTQAQNSLSKLLSSDEGIPRDLTAAIYWAKRAVAQGDGAAAFNLGTIYRDQGKPLLALRWYQRSASMGDNDALLQIGLCQLFGFGTKQAIDAARASFTQLLEGDPLYTCQRSRENALYWLAVIELIGPAGGRRRVARARAMLEQANADDDHEQANDILCLIGKSRYLLHAA